MSAQKGLNGNNASTGLLPEELKWPRFELSFGFGWLLAGILIGLGSFLAVFLPSNIDDLGRSNLILLSILVIGTVAIITVFSPLFRWLGLGLWCFIQRALAFNGVRSSAY